MKRTRRSIHAGAIIVFLAMVVPLQAEEADSVTRATEIWYHLVEGRYAEVLEQSTDQVRQGLAGNKLEQMWAGLVFQLGNFESVKSAESTSKGDFESVSLTNRFSRGDLVIRLVLDSQNRLAGMWIDKLVPKESTTVETPAIIREFEIEVVWREFVLPGTLSLPATGGPFPAVVLVHGSGPHDRDETVGANRPFRDLAWGLAERGVAVLRYEKRTHRYPEVVEAGNTTIDWEVVDDALAAIELARSNAEIDTRAVFVAGQSLGAMAAPRIAARDEHLAGVILIAGSPRSVLDLIDEQVGYLAAVDGAVTDDEAQEIARIRAITEQVRTGKFDGGDEILGAPAVYWHGLHEMDPAATLAGLDVPALIIHGGRDYQVPSSDAAIWKTRMAAKSNAEIVVFDELNHLMISGDGPSTPTEYQVSGHVDEDLIEHIARWVHNNTAKTASTPDESPES